MILSSSPPNIASSNTSSRVFSESEGFTRTLTKREEPEFRTVSNYSQLIKSARERKGLKQEDFAKFLNEKESVVAKWESGTMKPSIVIARKLENTLGIKLVEEEINDSYEKKVSKESDVLTLGDFIKVRKRK